MKENLDQEAVLLRIKEMFPESNLTDEQLRTAYNIICKYLTYATHETDTRIYIPKIGVVYREKLSSTPRLSASDTKGDRYKIKISAKPFYRDEN